MTENYCGKILIFLPSKNETENKTKFIIINQLCVYSYILRELFGRWDRQTDRV